MIESFKAVIGEMVTYFLVAVLGATIILGVILPADKVDALIIDMKADVVANYFSPTK
jgi:hypothetical protein